MGFSDDLRDLQRLAGSGPAPRHVASANELMADILRRLDACERRLGLGSGSGCLPQTSSASSKQD